MAFTLVEMLSVIGIIVILALLLPPLFQTLWEGANVTKCAGNLRQIGALFHAEAADQNGIIKMQWYKGPNSTKRWNNYLIEGGYLSKTDKIAFCPSVAQSGGVVASSDGGFVYGTVGFADPADPYSFNFDDAPNSRAIRLPAIEHPSEYWLLTDTWSTPNKHQIYIILNNATGLMHLRHRGRANMLFADGHVAVMSLEDTKNFAINPLNKAFDQNKQMISQ